MSSVEYNDLYLCNTIDYVMDTHTMYRSWVLLMLHNINYNNINSSQSAKKGQYYYSNLEIQY